MIDNMNKLIPDRIKTLRGKTAGRIIAKKAGITQAYFSQIELGQREPSLTVLQALAHALNTTVGYLVGESNDPTPNKTLMPQPNDAENAFATLPETHPEVESNLRPVPPDNVIWVPVVDKIVKACAGKGNGYSAECEWEIAYNYPVVDGAIAATHSPENLLMMTVEGDSMEPDIEEGELVLFDKVDPWVPGNIVVVYYNGKLMVKGILRQGDKIVLRSRNWQEYKDIVVDDDDVFFILGRVLRIAPPLKSPKSIM